MASVCDGSAAASGFATPRGQRGQSFDSPSPALARIPPEVRGGLGSAPASDFWQLGAQLPVEAMPAAQGNGAIVGLPWDDLPDEPFTDMKMLLEACTTVCFVSERSERSEGCCTVCLEQLRAQEEARRLPCQHVFHRRCVDPWLEQGTAGAGPSCPTCRRSLRCED